MDIGHKATTNKSHVHPAECDIRAAECAPSMYIDIIEVPYGDYIIYGSLFMCGICLTRPRVRTRGFKSPNLPKRKEDAYLIRLVARNGFLSIRIM